MQPSVETTAPPGEAFEAVLPALEEAVHSQQSETGENDRSERKQPELSVDSQADSSAFWLTRRDQITVAVLAMAAISCLAFTLWGGRYSHGEPLQRSSEVFWRVDMNLASEIELMVLKGVGPKLAARIVEERTTNGPFRSVDDLQRVHGFGPRTIEKNRERLRAVAPRRKQPRNETDSRAE